ncbi:MAG TPA: hypothetical protein VJQ45_02285 [Ktedonobacterales bacterium]|nr:hypothetical protein [Ktedonobacterales bacterium]
MINVRKLAALDIALHGAPLILAEFGTAIAIGTALGIWLITAAFAVRQGVDLFRLVVGGYFLCIAINYVPLLLYGIATARRKSARQEAAAELAEKDGRSARRYGAQSLLLILPLVIPVLALAQELRGRHGGGQ